MLRRLGLTLALLGSLVGCDDDAALVAVQLRTDYVPGAEVSEVVVERLDGTRVLASERMPLARGDDLTSAPRRVAELEVEPGDARLSVRLLGPDGAELAQRVVLAQVAASVAVTVVVTRDCRDVQCPGAGDDPSLEACLGGRCVDPRCTEESSERCGAAECGTAADCSAPTAMCADAECLVGTCLEVEQAGSCGAESYCDPAAGCLPLPGMPPDAGLDAGGTLSLEDVSPPWVPATGGTITVTLTGDVTDVVVSVDGTPCTNDPPAGTSIICDVPPHAPGVVPLTARGAVGDATNSKTLAYLRPGIQQVGGPGDDRTSGVGVALDGSIYISGGTTGDLDGTNAGDFDSVLAKFRPDGSLEWIRQLGTPAFDYAREIVIDDEGDAIVSGHTGGDLDGPGSFVGDEDVFVARYGSDGSLRWVTLIGSAGIDQSWDLDMDAAGDIWVAMRTDGDLDGTNAGIVDYALARLSPDGVVRWVRQGGTAAADVGHGLGVRDDGVAFLVGYTQGDLDGTNAGLEDLFVTRFEPDGTRAWTRQRGTAADDFAYDAVADATGVWVVGRTRGDLDGNVSAGGADTFLARFGDDGTHGFTRTFGSAGNEVSFGVDLAPSGQVFVSSTCQGSIDGEPAFGGPDLCVASYDAMGTFQWIRIAGSTETDSASSCTYDPAAGIVYLSVNTLGGLDGMASRGMGDLAFARFTASGQPL